MIPHFIQMRSSQIDIATKQFLLGELEVSVHQ